MTDFISGLERELDYPISDNTMNLSGGEKQRIVAIRCFAKNAKVLILDEPNSAFDKEGTQLLCEILQQIKAKNNNCHNT